MDERLKEARLREVREAGTLQALADKYQSRAKRLNVTRWALKLPGSLSSFIGFATVAIDNLTPKDISDTTQIASLAIGATLSGLSKFPLAAQEEAENRRLASQLMADTRMNRGISVVDEARVYQLGRDELVKDDGFYRKEGELQFRLTGSPSYNSEAKVALHRVNEAVASPVLGVYPDRIELPAQNQ